MTDALNETELSSELRDWIEGVGGGELVRADRRPGGGRREAWFVDVRRKDGGTDELFLRLDRSLPEVTGDPYTTVREAQVYRALAGTAIPVPRTLGVLDEPQAVLSERASGETWFSRIRDPETQLSVAQDFMRHLAALHRIDPRSLHIPAFPPLSSAREHLVQELDRWQGMYAFASEPPDPLIEFAFAWLRANKPAYEGPVVLVQGDTGPGNFLYRDGRVTAILDWELSHWGDPMDDLGWLSLRAVQEPFTHLPDRLAEYESLSGHSLDLGRIRYHRVFAELRVAILGHRRKDEQSSGGEIGNRLIYTPLHTRLLVEALADVLGIELEEYEPPQASPTERGWLYDAALDQLRDVIVPRSSDPFVIARAKGLARVLKHLRDADRLAPGFQAQELRDLAELLGSEPVSIAAGRDRLTHLVRAGEASEKALLRYFHRSELRTTGLARSASGALADRHFPPLE